MASHPSNAKYPDATAITYDEQHFKVTVIYNDHSIYVWDVRDIKKVGIDLTLNAKQRRLSLKDIVDLIRFFEQKSDQSLGKKSKNRKRWNKLYCRNEVYSQIDHHVSCIDAYNSLFLHMLDTNMCFIILGWKVAFFYFPLCLHLGFGNVPKSLRWGHRKWQTSST